MSTNAKRRRRRPPVAPPPPRPMLPIRLHAEQIDRVDALRPDMIPREPFIRQLLSDYLTILEGQEGEEE